MEYHVSKIVLLLMTGKLLSYKNQLMDYGLEKDSSLYNSNHSVIFNYIHSV